jgi:hypothetical protein
MRVHCFGCGKFAKSEDCELRRHQVSGIKRWFHRKEVKAGCLDGWLKEGDWVRVDPSLGETTHEEAMSIGHPILHLEDNKN